MIFSKELNKLQLIAQRLAMADAAGFLSAFKVYLSWFFAHFNFTCYVAFKTAHFTYLIDYQKYKSCTPEFMEI